MERSRPIPLHLKLSCLLTVVVLTFSGCLGGDGTGKNLPPQVSVTIESGSEVVDQGRPISFVAEAEDPDGEVVKYLWDFGDGETDTDDEVTHSYTLPGNYIVFLTVEDNDGAQSTNAHHLTYIEVLTANQDPDPNSPPTVLIAANPSVVQVGDPVILNGGGSWAWVDNGGDEPDRETEAINSYEWDFADDETSSVKKVTHSFDSPGNYDVRLKVSANNGRESQAVYSILVLAKPSPKGNVKHPTIFTKVSIGEPEWLDPAHSYETAGGEVIANVYEPLVWYDRDSTKRLKPQLATEVPTVANGGISEDGRVYTFELRQGVQFHDGSEMKAEDAAFSLDRAIRMDLSDGPAWMLTQVLNTTGIEATGEYTLQLTLERAYPAFLYIMAYTLCSVVSKNFVMNHGGVVEGQRNQYMDEHAMGTGPYRFIDWARGEYIKLEKFDDYWGGWDGDHVEVVFIKKDTELTSRELALLNGDADWAYIPITFRGDVEGKSGIDTSMSGDPTFNLGFIGFNQDINTDDNPNAAPSADFFADVRVRQAFCYSFDYDNFIDNVIAGSGMQARGPIPEGMLGFDDRTPMYEFDTQEAQALFEETGLWDSGCELTTYYNAGNTIREDGLQLLKNALEEMNPKFQMEVQALEWPIYLGKFRDKEMPLFFLGWAPDYADPDDYVQPFLHSEGHYPSYLSYSNPDMDELIDQASRELDPDVRESLYSDIQYMAYDEAAFIWVYQALTFHVERDWVEGYYFNPMYPGLYYYSLSKG